MARKRKKLPPERPRAALDRMLGEHDERMAVLERMLREHAKRLAAFYGEAPAPQPARRALRPSTVHVGAG